MTQQIWCFALGLSQCILGLCSLWRTRVGGVLGFDHNASSSEKVFWSESGEKSAQMPKQSKTTLNKHVAGFWCERQQQMLFFTGGSIIMDYGLNVFELKLSWWICFSFCLLQMLTDGLEWCGLWCFLSALILTAPIHCRASIDDGMTFLQIWWRNKLTLILIFHQNVHFWVDYSFKRVKQWTFKS